jgi:nucleotide-binding universal stress UspA family protein
MPFNRILCPVDLSPSSAPIVEHALAVAEAPGARVHVLHAVEPLLLQAATIAGEEAALRSEIDESLQRLVREALRRADHPPTIETSIAEGAPEAAILDLTQRETWDLIVMGLHGMNSLSKACFGSTLERVLRAASVPVLALPPRSMPTAGDGMVTPAFAHVVAAIDFEQPSMDAALVAADYAGRRGVDLTLLHVMPTAPVWGRWGQAVEQQHAIRRERAENELAMLAEELAGDRTPVQVVVREGTVWEQIALCGDERPGTLVVMGLRKPGRMLARPGSTAWRVLSAGSHPVLAAPARAPARRPIGRRSRTESEAYTETA